MTQYIEKSALVAKIKEIIEDEEESIKCFEHRKNVCELQRYNARIALLEYIHSFIDNIETKDMDLIIHTIIAECCDWLAMCTDLSHDEIEECRNLMLTVKDEQLKARKGE